LRLRRSRPFRPFRPSFTASWCGPCKMMAPYFEELSNMPEFAGLVFVKVDVDDLEDVAASAGVNAMPTFQVYAGGEKKKELVGANKDKLKAMCAESC